MGTIGKHVILLCTYAQSLSPYVRSLGALNVDPVLSIAAFLDTEGLSCGVMLVQPPGPWARCLGFNSRVLQGWDAVQQSGDRHQVVHFTAVDKGPKV